MEGQKHIDTTLIMGSIALMDVARKGLERVATVEGSGARRMKKTGACGSGTSKREGRMPGK